MSLFSLFTFLKFSSLASWAPPAPFNGTEAADRFVGGWKADLAFGFAGHDTLLGGAGNDTLHGGSGNDLLRGGCGNDRLFGDGPAEMVAVTTSFPDLASWQPALSADGRVIDLDGATVTAVGGAFTAFNGLSILSPSDNNPRQAWTREIDAFNDTPEAVQIAFDAAQSSVSFTLAQIYIERIFVTETEVALVKVLLENGTSVNTTLAATGTAFPGEASMTIDGTLTGGLKIIGLELTPNLALPSGVPAQFATNINARNPFTEWTLKSLSFSVDRNTLGTNDDTLCGGEGCDHLFGGLGNDSLLGGDDNDTLFGGAGHDRLFGGDDDDRLVGGAGNNHLEGGKGRDSFVFGLDATGVNMIADFSRGRDKLVFQDGVTVVGSRFEGGDTTLTLSNGGIIVLDDVRMHSDWQLFCG